MAKIAYNWYNNLEKFMDEHSDIRTKDLPFMKSPYPLVVFSLCYLYFVCKAGPDYMKDRKPFNLKKAITIYNTLQIAACIYLMCGMVAEGSFYMFACGPTEISKTYPTAKLIWWTLILKLTEYVETVFFVLRKKQNQVSGLHLYHHVSTLFFAWLTAKFAPVAVAVPPIVINSFIHVLMYSYYLVALHGGKEIQNKIVLWKRSLTILQMVQFTVIIAHLLVTSCQCQGPVFLLYLMVFNIFVNYFMFYKFYRKTYTKNKTK